MTSTTTIGDPTLPTQDPARHFHGAKVLLTCEGSLLTCLRENIPTIPFPHHWDLPGGGREGDETPETCVLRELFEEFGLHLAPERLTGRAYPAIQVAGMASWFFHGSLSAREIAAIRFGNEGECWRMMPVAEYLAHPKAIPHFRARIVAALGL